MKIVDKLISRHFNNKNDESRIKYIVIHYFGSLGSAEAVANYFGSTDTEASAHYCLDEKDVVYRCVVDGDIAWHCGAKNYKHPSCRNTNSIGIEVRPHKLNTKSILADDKDWYFKDEVIDNLVEFTKYLMAKYNVPVENVIRHYDVTGKLCPRPFVGDDVNKYYNKTGNQMWSEFKSRLTDEKVNKVETSEKKEETAKVEEKTFKVGDKVKLSKTAKQYTGNPIRTDYMNKTYEIKEIKNDRVVLMINSIVIYAVNIKDIVSVEKSTFESYLVKIDVDILNIRKGPGTSYGIVGKIEDRGTYTIVEESNEWGKLKSGAGWIHLGYVRKV